MGESRHSRVEALHTLTLKVYESESGTTLEAEGEIDLACATLLESELRQAEERGLSIRLDLSGLRFIDSTGLRILLEARDRSADDSHVLAIQGATGPVKDVIELTALSDRILGES
jgi:anti-sigma B factor antagonist